MLGAGTMSGAPGQPDTAEQYVRDLVDGWPALTDTQRGRLAALLHGGEGGDDGG